MKYITAMEDAEMTRRMLRDPVYVKLLPDSCWFEMIVNKARTEGAVMELIGMIERLGTHRFGTPSPSVLKTIRGIDDASVLQQITVRILDANDWQESLATVKSL